MAKQPLHEAIRQILAEEARPIITARELNDLVRSIYSGKYSEQFNVRIQTRTPSDLDVYRAIQRLQSARVVREDPDFGSNFYQIFDVLEQSAEAVCCEADPFSYVSHLSAMQVHGLTERSPTALVLTRPDETLWRQMRDEGEPKAQPAKMLSPSRPRYAFPAQARGRSILIHDTRHPGAWEAAGPHVRTATVGQTFLDMVVRPGWCGGASHVMEVWRREAEQHLNEIVAAVDAYPVKLPKVRAGYILDEVVGIADLRALAWLAFAQRGGSQKLDPERPYAPIFSEKWMLSINA